MVSARRRTELGPCPELSMYMIWHARYHQDPAHRWLREQLLACVTPALAA